MFLRKHSALHADTLKRKAIVLVCLVCLFAIAFSLLDYRNVRVFTIAGVVNDLRGPVFLVVYLIVYVLSVVAVIASLCLENMWLRRTVTVVMVLLSACNLFMLQTFSEPLSLEHLMIARAAPQATNNFLVTYYKSFLTILAATGAFYLALGLVARRALGRASSWAIALPLVALCGVFAIVYRTSGSIAGFPSPFVVPSLATAAMTQTPLFDGDREQPLRALLQGKGAGVPVVFMVVDESVGGDYLSVNGFPKPSTAFLDAHPDLYTNLGIACSAGNHSILTSLILQAGVQQFQLPDKNQAGLKQPNIFQYAKAQGYTTVFADAQSRPNKYNSFMRRVDFSAIDVYLESPGEEFMFYERDRRIFDQIEELMRKHDKLFVYFAKAGVHFPYVAAYPADDAKFKPVMTSNTISSSSPEEILNSYLDGIVYATDKFLERLLPLLDRSRSALVYTGDHGQSIREIREAGTHGKVADPPISQARVPMIVYGKPIEDRVREHKAQLYGRTTHFQIFPSLMILLGYDPTGVNLAYGKALWQSYDKPRMFLSGDLFARGRATMYPCDR